MSNTDVGGAWGEPRPTTGDTTGGGSVKDKASSAAQAVKQEAATFAEDARGKAAEKIEQHKQTATQTLGDFANAIRKAGDELANTDQSVATRLVRQAADGLENFARTVSDKRPEELLDTVRDFGRRNPTALIAGSVLAGLALGRFLTASSSAATRSSNVDSSGGSLSSPSTYSGLGGVSSGVGLSETGPIVNSGATSDALGSVDPTAAGATSLGASDADLDGEAEVALGDPLGVVEDSGVLSDDLTGSGDKDRSRFGSGS